MQAGHPSVHHPVGPGGHPAGKHRGAPPRPLYQRFPLRNPEAPNANRSLADPGALAPLKPKPEDTTSGVAQPGTELLQVIIETPRGSRNKYSYDADQRIYLVKATLPVGMVFPYDFGFLPQTIGGDGDPLDVLVLMDEPCFPGCAVLARLLGVMETEQTVNGGTTRNDRLITVADTAHIYSLFRTVDDLPEQFRTELSAFFANYHRLQNKHSRTLGWQGPSEARRLIEQGKRDAQQPPSEA